MKIGILGAGNLGSAIAKRLLGHKHQVLLSFARDETAMTAFGPMPAGSEAVALAPVNWTVART